jgi:mono/diheme cytochrome c family protein
MRSLRFLLPALAVMMFAASHAGWAQSPTYGLGKTPTQDEIRAWDISISPTGKELPQGSGSAKQGAAIYAQKCVICHGATGSEGPAPMLIKRQNPPANPGPCVAFQTGRLAEARRGIRTYRLYSF